MTHDTDRPVGRVLTAMVTPFTGSGELDLDGARRLATHLVDQGSDGLLLNGTTGESPTTSDDEKVALVRAVLDTVGDRAHIVTGVGTYDTAHSVELAKKSRDAGAHGLLAVTPYYSLPPQEGLVAHFTAIADATDLPVILYDIPHRTGRAIESATLRRLADHPRIVAVKDAKGDLGGSAEVLARTDLAYYSGDDIHNLPLLSVGAIGVISVVSHLAAGRIGDLIDAYEAGQVARARELHASLLPLCVGLFRTQAAILTKAALGLLGLPGGSTRLPLPDPTAEQIAVLRQDLEAGGVPVPMRGAA